MTKIEGQRTENREAISPEQAFGNALTSAENREATTGASLESVAKAKKFLMAENAVHEFAIDATRVGVLLAGRIVISLLGLAKGIITGEINSIKKGMEHAKKTLSFDANPEKTS